MTSRLHDLTGATSPLFEVTLGASSYTDPQITGMALSRGGDSDGPGLLTNTATINVGGEAEPPRNDDTVTVALTTAGATLLEGLVGNRAAAELQPRWSGRIGRQSVTDHLDDLTETQVVAADWLVELARSEQPAPGVTSGEATSGILLKALNAAALPFTPTVTRNPSSLASWPSSVGAGTHTWADLSEKFARDAGTLMYQARGGGFVAANLVGREAAAAALDPTTSQPLTRRQCLSPSGWEQPTSNPTLVKWSRPIGGGSNVNKQYRIGSGSRTIAETVTNVSAVVYFGTTTEAANFDMSMEGRAYRLGGWGYRLEQVTIDLLRLLSSPLTADRELAGQLLTYEPFDPVLLMHDWPDTINGHHFITDIADTITADRWDITLKLMPAVQLVGSVAESYTLPEGLTWDTGRPRTETWDTIPNHDWNGD